LRPGRMGEKHQRRAKSYRTNRRVADITQKRARAMQTGDGAYRLALPEHLA